MTDPIPTKPEIPEGAVVFGLEERPSCETIMLLGTIEDARAVADMEQLTYGWQIVRWEARRDPDGVVRLHKGDVVEDRWNR